MIRKVVSFVAWGEIDDELLKKFENLWVSVTFAEAGEHETLQQILAEETHDETSGEICPAA
jgi:hypothetical protein